ncbi:MAG: hypothetical protein HFI91_02875 [Lachnospiraceae bacterium]|jgi:hypothetical protein|nr:hypothetical protein [Lachnospiraceae bacterium]
MANNRSGKIRQYRKPLNINLGMIIFGCISVYIVICVVLYFTSSHIIGYEVKAGSLSVDNVYKGIAIRQEEIVSSTGSGYINYYAREGGRVAVGDLVYTVDETGKIAEMVGVGDPDENSLSNEDLGELKSEILGFTSTFSPQTFSEVYDFKYDVQGTVMKLANYRILENIDVLNASTDAGLVDFCRAAKTGIIIYSTDGYEELTADQVKMADFDTDKYEKKPLISNDLVNKGDAAYKISLSEHWSIVIPVTPERAAELTEAEYVQVKFLKNQNISWGQVAIHENEDGTYAELMFNNSMLTFCTDRYIDIELITEDETGLKIPNTAIVEKEFFLVPIEYVTKGGNSGADGVLREVYTPDGKAGTEFIETPIYDEADGEYYLDDSTLRIGDYILKPDSMEKYPISKRGKLTGVYNINKGYADFKKIQVLSDNEEYSIVKSGTTYGLSVYDYIALDASSVEEHDFTSE